MEPPIILTSADLDRLEHLLDTVSPLHTPGLDALQRELDRAEVMESHQIPADVITMNSTARFMDETSGKEFELTLVYPDDALMSSDGTVSVLAPVGSALLGLSVGQAIEWPLPGGRKMSLRVLAVTYQPEATRHAAP